MAFDPPTIYVTVIRLLAFVVRFLPKSVAKVNNYCRRPKLGLKVTTATIVFCDIQGVKRVPSFLGIELENRGSRELHLDLNSANFNGTTLRYIIQQNQFFAKTHPQTKSELRLTTENKLMNTFRENWNGNNAVKIPPHETLVIPLGPEGLSDQMFFKVAKSANLFCVEDKFVVELKIDSHEYHFAVNRHELVKRLVNILFSRRNQQSSIMVDF